MCIIATQVEIAPSIVDDTELPTGNNNENYGLYLSLWNTVTSYLTDTL
jgi:hypothetical protein